MNNMSHDYIVSLLHEERAARMHSQGEAQRLVSGLRRARRSRRGAGIAVAPVLPLQRRPAAGRELAPGAGTAETEGTHGRRSA